MSTSATRWNLVVSSETDQALRQYLAGSGGGHKGDLSRFVEAAVQARIWELTVEQVKAKNADRPQKEIESIIDEALAWARHR
ncbi:MAG: ribbon-helix-helix domain-containing protein [Silvibacterium sp.]